MVLTHCSCPISSLYIDFAHPGHVWWGIGSENLLWRPYHSVSWHKEGRHWSREPWGSYSSNAFVKRLDWLISKVTCTEDATFQQIVQTAVSKLHQSLVPLQFDKWGKWERTFWHQLVCHHKWSRSGGVWDLFHQIVCDHHNITKRPLDCIFAELRRNDSNKKVFKVSQCCSSIIQRCNEENL